MGKLKIYLDCCCFNRPFDDQSDDKVRLESEAVLSIIDRCEADIWDVYKSDILLDEILDTKDFIRKQKLLSLYSSATLNVELNNDIVKRAKEIREYNIKAFDSLHVACAEFAEADIFLTTDKKLINRSMVANLKVRVLNPAVWIMEVL